MINYKKIKCNVVAVVLNANISSWRALALLLQMALMKCIIRVYIAVLVGHRQLYHYHLDSLPTNDKSWPTQQQVS